MSVPTALVLLLCVPDPPDACSNSGWWRVPLGHAKASLRDKPRRKCQESSGSVPMADGGVSRWDTSPSAIGTIEMSDWSNALSSHSPPSNNRVNIDIPSVMSGTIAA